MLVRTEKSFQKIQIQTKNVKRKKIKTIRKIQTIITNTIAYTKSRHDKEEKGGAGAKEGNSPNKYELKLIQFFFVSM